MVEAEGEDTLTDDGAVAVDAVEGVLALGALGDGPKGEGDQPEQDEGGEENAGGLAGEAADHR